MNRKVNKRDFPGQKTGIIRVLIKHGQREETIQVELDLFEEKDKSIK